MSSGRDGKVVFRVLSLFCAMTMILSLIPWGETANAAELEPRVLTLQANGATAGSVPGGVVNHLFSFTIPTGGNVGSIQFLYCTTASNSSCLTPTGLVTTSATLGTQTGATGFTLNNTTNGAPYITRTAASVSASTAVTYQLVGVTNPTGVFPSSTGTFFVRISTYTAASLGGTVTDTGTVAASTANQITLTGVMPESLIFCTGGTISTSGGIPDCSTATSGSISFNQNFSPTATATATNQMAASTNASSGYVITVNGSTLTSGGNSITAIGSTATTSNVGTRQFGMNLRANTTASSTPAVGTDVAPAANGSNLKGEALTGYSTVDNFAFSTGASVADSGYSGAGPTDAQIYTVSYIVNVSGGVAAGTYTTTLTYICTPTY